MPHTKSTAVWNKSNVAAPSLNFLALWVQKRYFILALLVCQFNVSNSFLSNLEKRKRSGGKNLSSQHYLFSGFRGLK